jgi:LacI family transcriptional regulator
MITIRELARLAGVAPSTVMRALQNCHVAPDTRERILALAEKHRYVPVARVSDTLLIHHPVIGCIIPGTRNMGNASLLDALVEKAGCHNYHLLIKNTRSLLARTLEALRSLEALKVDGIIMHSGHFTAIPADAIQRVLARNIPIVTLDVTPTETPLDWVGIDEAALGEAAVAYLHGLGHEHIGYVGTLVDEFTVGRPYGVKQALERRGLSTAYFVRNDGNLASVQRGVRMMLVSTPRPTAFFAASDTEAMAVISEVAHQGLSVPRHVSVLGCGEYPQAPLTIPPLSSFDLRRDSLYQQAIDLLFERILHQDHPPLVPPQRVPITARLVTRGSCAPCAPG